MTRRGLLLFIAMCVIWGIPYLFIRIAVEQISPAALVFFRTSLAALVLLPIAINRGSLAGLQKHWKPLLAFAVVEIGVPWFAISSAERQISSSLAGLLISAVPLVATVLSLTLGSREKTGPAALFGLVIGVVGVAAIVGLDLRNAGLVSMFEMAVVVVGYALGPVILSRNLAGLPAVGVMAVALTFNAVVYAPIAAFQWPHSLPSPALLLAIAVLAVVCTALAFLLFAELINEVGPVRSTVITYVNPAVAAVLGVLILGESFTIGMGAGFLLILAGSVLATRRPPAPVAA